MISYLQVFIILGFIDFCSTAIEEDGCTSRGMSKTMRRLRCEKVDKLSDDQDLHLSQHMSTVVQDQYTDLPYPPFTMFDMMQEQLYYSTHTNSHVRPKFYQHTNSLNLLNHYLYKVSIIIITQQYFVSTYICPYPY